MSKHSKTPSNQIVANRKARHEFFIEESIEAGLALEGWEVKSLREGKVQLNEAYVLLKDGEAFLFGCLITPLPTASTHITPDTLRNRKLLLQRRELNKLFGAVKKKGYTCVPLDLHWRRGNIKCNIALARGKKLYDKRATEKERDWQRQKQRLTREH